MLKTSLFHDVVQPNNALCSTECFLQARAAFLAGGVLIAGGWVDPKKAVSYVDWALLLLVGSALGLSKAIANSGLAGYAGNAIRDSGMTASTSLYVLYGFTMVCHPCLVLLFNCLYHLYRTPPATGSARHGQKKLSIRVGG